MLRLLSADPALLEPGLVALDARVPLAGGVVADLLACDRLGDPVLVLLVDDDPALAVGRVAALLAAWEQQRGMLAHVYGPRGLDPAQRPRYVLLARRFPDATPMVLDVLAGLEVRAVEYRLVRTADGRAALDLFPFHRTSPVRPVAAPASQAPAPVAAEEPRDGASFLAGVDAAGAARELFLRAFASLTDLAEGVEAEGSGGRVAFRVGDAPLATLVLERRGVRLAVGDEGEAPRVVTDEASLHEALNAVFGHYFTHLADVG